MVAYLVIYQAGAALFLGGLYVLHLSAGESHHWTWREYLAALFFAYTWPAWVLICLIGAFA